MIDLYIDSFLKGEQNHQTFKLPKNRIFALVFEGYLKVKGIRFVFQDDYDCYWYHLEKGI